MNRKTTLHWAFFLLSLSYAWTMLTVVEPDAGALVQGIVIRTQPREPVWKTITAQQVESGATIPKHTNVIFHLPFDTPKILRRTLIGEKVRGVRYWGYCFPEVYDPSGLRSEGLPGKVFLSEAERKWRRAQEAANKPMYSIYHPPRGEDLSERAKSTIRHQLEAFQSGMTCYIMTEAELSIGTDRDGDGLNVRVENEVGSDPANPDTDGDGITDGTEVQIGFTNPLLRDSDGDGIIEAFEDRNRNGKFEQGETDPTKIDSDGDALCDGYCRVSNTKRVCQDNLGRDCVTLPFHRWQGEDRNFNGIVDTNETDPRTQDTDSDGVLDEQEYYQCILDKKPNC